MSTASPTGVLGEQHRIDPTVVVDRAGVIGHRDHLRAESAQQASRPDSDVAEAD